MFKETKEGQTHSFNDGCGIQAHNPTLSSPMDRCKWCGMMHAEHDVSRDPNAPTPMVQCQLLVSGFLPEQPKQEEHKDCPRLGKSDLCVCCPCGCGMDITEKHYPCSHGQRCGERDCPEEEPKQEEWEYEMPQAILAALEYRGFNDCGKYLDDDFIEKLRPIIRSIESRTRVSALEEAISYIGNKEGWEESEDIYRKHFGLPTKYTPQ